MNQRMMIIAVALTAFVLVLVGGLTVYLNQLQPGAAAAVATDPTLLPAAGLDPSTEALIREREATYATALAEANARLEAANAQLAQAAAAAPAAVAPAMPAAAPATPSYAVSAAQAELIALQNAPGAVLSTPAELVRYQGIAAYEVRLDRGLVYIDAQSGAVLANGAVIVAAADGLISTEEAIQVATDYMGGGSVVDAALVTEDGVTVYAVRFNDGREIYVDAAGGQVVYAAFHEHEGEHEDSEHDD
jgi:uncharacterized membrane protein YkoI